MPFYNDCWTYFYIDINNPEIFDYFDFCKRLGLDAKEMEDWSTDDSIEIGHNRVYRPNLNEMVRETLKDLFGKEHILVELACEYDLEYTLHRVPTIVDDAPNPTPILRLDRDIIEFLYLTNTKDNLDYFIDMNALND